MVENVNMADPNSARPRRPTTRTVRSRFASPSASAPAATASTAIGNTNGVPRGPHAAATAEDGSAASSSGTSTSTTVTLTLMPKHRSPSSPKSSKKSTTGGRHGHHHHHGDHHHHNMRERWLLTRKTWRYMADAGRKLIPDAATSLGRHKSSSSSGGVGGAASGSSGGRLADDLARLEEHFQQLCRAEPKFLPWRRKASYPGALTSLRRRKRGGRTGGAAGSSGASSMSPTSPPKASSADEADEEAARGEDEQRLMLMIRMLEKYLNIQAEDEAEAAEAGHQRHGERSGEYGGEMYGSRSSGTSDMKMAGSLYYEHSEEVDRSSPGAGRQQGENRAPLILSQTNEQLKQNWLAQPYDGGRQSQFGAVTSFRASAGSSGGSSKGGSSLTSPTLPTIIAGQTQAFFQSENQNAFGSSTSAAGSSASKERNPEWATSMHTSLLLDNLRHYSRSNRNPLLSYDRITSDVLTDKRLLRQIRDELKQQQLQRILQRHSSRISTSSSSSALNLFPIAANLRPLSRHTTTASSSSSSSIFSFWQRDPRDPTTASSIHLRHVSEDQQDADRSSLQDRRVGPTSTASRVHFQRRYVTSGTQTDPIPITHLQQLHIDYRKRVDAEAAAAAAAAAEEAPPITPPPGGAAKHSRRKSSIDNEDVSQSVSDTIKRYLRMARKKSVHESDADRFKRVNYDQTLRNIKPKGEITMPGDDDDANTKGAQTDGDWIVRVISEIRALGRQLGVLPGGAAASGSGGNDGEDALPRATNIHSIMGMRPTPKKHSQPQPQPPRQSSSTTSPSSGSGLFHSSTQFLSNLLPWHSDKSSSSAPQSPTTAAQPTSPPLQQPSRDHNHPTNTSPPPSCSSSVMHHSSQSLFFSSSSTTSSSTATPTSPPPSDVASRTADTMQPPSLAQQLLQSAAATATATATSTTAQSAAAAAAAQQLLLTKSKSSSNVSQTFAKKIWKSRSKSQSRTASPSDAGRLGVPIDSGVGAAADADRVKSDWLPQGNGVWTSVRGESLQLHETRLFELGEPERLALHRVAVDRIGQLNIGVNVTPPDGNPIVAPAPKKRRPLMLKRKALTTGFFDTAKSKEDASKSSGASGGGLVFGIGLQKVVDNDRMLLYRRGSVHGSAQSLCADNLVGSCESLPGHTIRGGVYQHHPPSSTPRIESTVAGDELQVPQLVRACCSHLLEHGMSTVGIFRVGTIKRRVEQLKEEFDRGDCRYFEPDAGSHDVAYLLKDFLRSMPEPLLCRSLYAAFLQTQKIRNRRLQLEAMSHLIQLLPVAHRDTLYTLLHFLAEVARHAEDSTVVCRETGVRTLVTGHRMDASNLATVMSPNILHDTQLGQAASEAEVGDRLDVINVVRTMIDHCDELFVVPVDILDDVYAQLMDADPRHLNELCDAHLAAASRTGDATSISVFSPHPDTQTRAPDFGGAPPEPTPRRMYVRQELMHENAVRGADRNGGGGSAGTGGSGSSGAGLSSGSPAGATTIKRRERTSKMRYQEPENEMAGLRRRRAVVTATAASGSRITATDASSFSASNRLHHQGASGGVGLTTTTAPLKSQSSSTIHSSSSSSFPAPLDPWVLRSAPRSSSIDLTGAVVTPTPSPKLSTLEHRRLSSPFVQHDSGVMSASLQLPVQLQQQQLQSTTTPFHRASPQNSTLNLGAEDLAQIPYIEDGSGSSGNSGVNVGGATYLPTPPTPMEASPTPVARTGSLKRGSMLLGSAASAVAAAAAHRIRGVTGGSSSTASTTASVQQRRTVEPPNSITIASLSLGQQPLHTHEAVAFGSSTSVSAPSTPARPTPPEKTRVEKSSSGSSLLKAAVGLSKKSLGLSSSSSSSSAAAAAVPPRVESLEPRVSTSISTIGSEVLRSKTADFERMLHGQQQRKASSGSGGNGNGGSSAMVTAAPSRGTAAAAATVPSAAAQRVGPIYKRQELISSRQSSKK